MQESSARQMAAVRLQNSPRDTRGFFTLPPPAPIGVFSSARSRVDCAPLPRPEVDALSDVAAAREGLDPDFLRSVMRRESGFRPCAVSAKGAMGLMQLAPATAWQYGLTNPFNPADNLAAGARLLKHLLVRYNGERALALGAYNAGPAAVDSAHGVPQFRETVDYVARILSSSSQ